MSEKPSLMTITTAEPRERGKYTHAKEVWTQILNFFKANPKAKACKLRISQVRTIMGLSNPNYLDLYGPLYSHQRRNLNNTYSISVDLDEGIIVVSRK